MHSWFAFYNHTKIMETNSLNLYFENRQNFACKQQKTTMATAQTNVATTRTSVSPETPTTAFISATAGSKATAGASATVDLRHQQKQQEYQGRQKQQELG
jgi:hypothetical protein